MSPVIIWTILFAVFLFLEFLTPGDLITIWFSAGALVTCILAACGVNFTVRIICFLSVAFISMLLFRPLCIKFIKKNVGKQNLNTMVNLKVKTIEPVFEDKMGTVKIDGVVWSCTSEDGKEIASGTNCIVVEVRGNKLIIKPE